MFLFGSATRWPNLLFLSGKVPRSFHKFVSVLKMTGGVFQAISRGFFFKVSVFTVIMAPKGANRPVLLRICTGSAGDHLYLRILF